MELFETRQHYIVLDGEHSLWCDRENGKLTAGEGFDIKSVGNHVCLGTVYGIIGKVRISAESEKLLLISQTSYIGHLSEKHKVFGINRIAVLPISTKETPDLGIELCKKHHFGINKTVVAPEKQPISRPLQKTWTTILTATTQVKGKKKDPKDRDKFDKRITDELVKMFTDTESFYFSPTGDLTNSIQRQCQQKKDPNIPSVPLWHRVDERFFWNKHMLQEIIEIEGNQKDHWILPIIQGFVNIESCHLDFNEPPTTPEINASALLNSKLTNIGLILISRRSRHRAGTRYRRRGVDELGKVANYVETEQIIEYDHHTLSFVQVRGSVPVYWSQPGYKYRPPPRLERDEEETKAAFERHFQEELSIYGTQAIINLAEKSGKERVLGDAYFNQILNYDSPSLTYITFDFHEYCRGMTFENVSVLISSIQDIIKEMMYCWMDEDGIICEQKGAVRVNCIDCLDRTNVVQSHIAKKVLELQFTKLGLVSPEGILPLTIRSTLQIMWANNGDSLSRQYAGTAALKGDYTRTGERRLAGMMKDGYNSANRYYLSVFKDVYRQATISLMLGETLSEDLIREAALVESCLEWAALPTQTRSAFINELPFGLEIHLLTAAAELTRYYLNRFKDAYRQATIDLMMGNPVSQEDLGVSPDRENAENDANWSEHVKQLIEECKKILVPDSEVIMGGWALIDADPDSGDPRQQDADTILILTRDSYYVASYDDETDRISKYQKVMLEDLESIDLGPESNSLFKSKYHCARLNYKFQKQRGYFHMFRSTNIRFFNNMAIDIKTEEEAIESLKAICDTFLVALEVLDHKVPFNQGKLQRKRSKVSFSQGKQVPFFGGLYLEIPSLNNIPRNVSEGQLMALKNAGSQCTKAFNTMTSQIAKLTPKAIRSSMHGQKDAPQTAVTPGAQERPQFRVESSSESDDEPSSHPQEVVLASCGILITQSSRPSLCGQNSDKEVIEGAGAQEASKRSEAIKNLSLDITAPLHTSATWHVARPKTPEIHISKEDDVDSIQSKGASCHQVLSQSSDSVERFGNEECKLAILNLNSPSDAAISVKALHAAGTIKEISPGSGSPLTTPLASPSTMHKELVLAPFTKIAKGVQNLGMNLQRATSRHGRLPEVVADQEAYERLKQRRRNCRSRLIDL